jgi:hypothetical protein
MYANRQPARDGYIPEQVLPMLYPLAPKQRARLCDRLVEVGLWERVQGGYQIHEFKAWNRTKEQVEVERESTRLRVAEFRRNKTANSESNGSRNGVTQNTGNENVPDPLRSTPLPTEPDESSARASDGSQEPEPRLTSCPLDLREKAESVGIVRDFVEKYRVEPEQIHEVIREFVSYWIIGGGMGRTHANWPKKLREHLRRACEKPGGLKPIGELEHEQHGGGGTSRSVKAAKDAGAKAMALMREAQAMGGK